MIIVWASQFQARRYSRGLLCDCDIFADGSFAALISAALYTVMSRSAPESRLQRRQVEGGPGGCEDNQCDLVTMGHNAYRLFTTARGLADLITGNNIV